MADLDAILSHVTSEDPEMRRKAVEALVPLARKDLTDATVQAFRTLARDADPDVQVRALRAAGVLHLGATIPELIEALGDYAHADVRFTAAEALGLLGAREAVPVLVDLLADEDPKVVRYSVEALGRIGDPGGLPALARLYGDAAVGLQERIIRAVGAIGGPPALDLIRDWAGEGDSGVIRECLGVLATTRDAGGALDLIEQLMDKPAFREKSVLRKAARVALRGLVDNAKTRYEETKTRASKLAKSLK